MKHHTENISAVTVVHTSVWMALTFVPHYCSDIQSLHGSYSVCVNNQHMIYYVIVALTYR